jgi:hypothetical protein
MEADKKQSKDINSEIATCKVADKLATLKMAIAANYKDEAFEIDLTYGAVGRG